MLDRLERYAQALADYTELRLHNNYLAHSVIRKGALIENRESRRGGVSARLEF